MSSQSPLASKASLPQGGLFLEHGHFFIVQGVLSYDLVCIQYESSMYRLWTKQMFSWKEMSTVRGAEGQTHRWPHSRKDHSSSVHDVISIWRRRGRVRLRLEHRKASCVILRTLLNISGFTEQWRGEAKQSPELFLVLQISDSALTMVLDMSSKEQYLFIRMFGKFPSSHLYSVTSSYTFFFFFPLLLTHEVDWILLLFSQSKWSYSGSSLCRGPKMRSSRQT